MLKDEQNRCYNGGGDSIPLKIWSDFSSLQYTPFIPSRMYTPFFSFARTFLQYLLVRLSGCLYVYYNIYLVPANLQPLMISLNKIYAISKPIFRDYSCSVGGT